MARACCNAPSRYKKKVSDQVLAESYPMLQALLATEDVPLAQCQKLSEAGYRAQDLLDEYLSAVNADGEMHPPAFKATLKDVGVVFGFATRVMKALGSHIEVDK